jgi:hypothetical protein
MFDLDDHITCPLTSSAAEGRLIIQELRGWETLIIYAERIEAQARDRALLLECDGLGFEVIVRPSVLRPGVNLMSVSGCVCSAMYNLNRCGQREIIHFNNLTAEAVASLLSHVPYTKPMLESFQEKGGVRAV